MIYISSTSLFLASSVAKLCPPPSSLIFCLSASTLYPSYYLSLYPFSSLSSLSILLSALFLFLFISTPSYPFIPFLSTLFIYFSHYSIYLFPLYSSYSLLSLSLHCPSIPRPSFSLTTSPPLFLYLYLCSPFFSIYVPPCPVSFYFPSCFFIFCTLLLIFLSILSPFPSSSFCFLPLHLFLSQSVSYLRLFLSTSLSLSSTYSSSSASDSFRLSNHTIYLSSTFYSLLSLSNTFHIPCH